MVGAPKSKGRPKAKAKVKQQRADVGGRFGPLAAAASAGEGGASASACGAAPVQPERGATLAHLKKLVGLSSSDDDPGADGDVEEALRVFKAATVSDDDPADDGDSCGSAGRAQFGMSSPRGGASALAARRALAKSVLGLSSSDEGPGDGEFDAPPKFAGRFGCSGGPLSDGDSEDDEGGGAGGRFRKGRGRAGRKALRSPRRLQVAGADVPADASKRFTPSVVDDSRCLARTWGGGRGGQCSKRPLPGHELCAQHHAELSFKNVGGTHGLVTGEVSRAKLLEFMRYAR